MKYELHFNKVVKNISIHGDIKQNVNMLAIVASN